MNKGARATTPLRRVLDSEIQGRFLFSTSPCMETPQEIILLQIQGLDKGTSIWNKIGLRKDQSAKVEHELKDVDSGNGSRPWHT